MHIDRSLLVTFLALALSACGGGEMSFLPVSADPDASDVQASEIPISGDVPSDDATDDDTTTDVPDDTIVDGHMGDILFEVLDTASEVPDATTDTTEPADTIEVTPPAPAPGWRLTFADEFNGPENPDDPCYDTAQTPPLCLDLYWNRVVCAETIGDVPVHTQLKDLDKCTWAVYDFQNWMDGSAPFGHRINNLDPREVRVEDGELILAASATEPDGDGWDCGRDIGNYYTSKECPIRSGAIMSNPWKNWDESIVLRGFAQAFGRFEVRARLSDGPGSWPAHWLLPTQGGWPEAGEIDIMEYWQGSPTRYAANYHGGDYNPHTEVRTHYWSARRHDTGDRRWVEEYHVYAVEWEPGHMAFLVDDLEIGRIHQGDPRRAKIEQSSNPDDIGDYVDETLDIPQIPFFWILNTSVVPFNGGLTSMEEVEAFPGMEHRIDYVRVYERCTTGPETPDEPCGAAPPRARAVTDQFGMNSYRWSSTQSRLVAGDFNGDKASDMLLMPTSILYNAWLLLSDGHGDFAPAVNVVNAFGMSSYLSWTHDPLVADFDADGYDDVILRPETAAEDTLMLRGNPVMGFESVSILAAGGTEANARWPQASHAAHTGDFDADGRTDVLLVGRTPLTPTYLLTTCSPPYGFLDEQILTDEFGLSGDLWAEAHHVVHVADFDGDDRDDVLLQGREPSDRTWFLRSKSSTMFATLQDVTDRFGMMAEKWAAASQKGITGDFNGDDRTDFLLQPRTNGGAAMILYGQTANTFGTVSVITMSNLAPEHAFETGFALLHVLDLDNNGASDLLFQATTPLYSSHVLMGSAQGFAPIREVTRDWVFSNLIWPDSSRELNVGDFNGDGVSDFMLRPRMTVGDEQAYLVLVDRLRW